MSSLPSPVSLENCEQYKNKKVTCVETDRICRGVLNQLKIVYKENIGFPIISEFLPDSKQYIITLYYDKEKYCNFVIELCLSVRLRVMGFGDNTGFYPVLGFWFNVFKSKSNILKYTFYKLNRALENNFGGNFNCYKSYCKELSRFTFWAKNKSY